MTTTANHVNPNFRNDACLFACVEGIVYSLFYRGKQRLAWIIKPKQVPILGEKLTNRDIPLFRRHAFGGNSPAGSILRGQRFILRERIRLLLFELQ